MCHYAKLPVIGKISQIDTDLMKTVYMLNRWMKMLNDYGHLDQTSLNKDFNLISKVLKAANVKKRIKGVIRKCRDYAISSHTSIDIFKQVVKFALDIICDYLNDMDIVILENQFANQGMTERYRPLTQRLTREKIHKIGNKTVFIDEATDDAKTKKLVRRIVEKRAAQDVYRLSRDKSRTTNEYRQRVRRATSFSIFNSAFVEYDQSKRVKGTHWKVVKRKNGKMLKSKKSYPTYEDAISACERYMCRYPDDPIPMSAYKCDYCGKWHIGHDRIAVENSGIDIAS